MKLEINRRDITITSGTTYWPEQDKVKKQLIKKHCIKSRRLYGAH